MSKYIIEGGHRLRGEVNIKAAKNSVLPLIAASLMTEGKVVLRNCPNIADVEAMLRLIKSLGVEYAFSAGTIELDTWAASDCEVPAKLAQKLRASFFLLGPMLARFGCAKIAFPGGCDLGSRPVNIHIEGLKKLNVKIEEPVGKYLICDGRDMLGNVINFPFPSVGATENIMMAACAAKGITIIKNAAKEPEILDLQNMLNLMGADVSGAGGDIIKINGKDKFNKDVIFTPIPDRIVAGTYILAAALCGGDVTIKNCQPYNLVALTRLLNSKNCELHFGAYDIRVLSRGRQTAFPMVETLPFPFFPTDLQPQLMTLACVCRGVSRIKETIFETRFNNIGELIKMGADILLSDRIATVKGVDELHGADVSAFDLRGGAGMVLAGMRAFGRTTVCGIEHIERGYEAFDLELRNLGADIVKTR